MGKPRCLETRSHRGVKMRRYRYPDDSEHYTYEIPRELFDSLVLVARDERWYPALSVDGRNTLIRNCLKEGWKPLAVAMYVGISLTTVYRVGGKK